ncbi:MAG: Lipoteichoic acid synthase 2 [bacterium ADurb.Bin157]|nr:MAG: Lipoteichoic acid synthase 2 [bacterium ADurb.Bin157]
MLSKIKLNYLPCRCVPFLFLLLIFEILVNLILTFVDFPKFDFSLVIFIKMLLVMFVQTIIVGLHMLLPYSLYLILLPSKLHKSKIDKIFTYIIFFVFTSINFFSLVSEVIFWSEFECTFNFIAVDYLVYTREVIGNIVQSFSLPLIVLGVLLVGILGTFMFRKKLVCESPVPRLAERLKYSIVLVLLCVLSFFSFDIKMSELVGENTYNVEVAKNGAYSFFSAFLNNEINYKDFYIVNSKKSNLDILKDKLKQDDAEFLDENSIARRISPAEKEIKANLIIVLMESLGMKYFDKSMTNNNDIVPNLRKLAAEGMFFPKTYANGTRSVRGIESVSLGAPPLPGASIVRKRNNGNLYTIGSIFREKDYETKWIYGGYGYFDNMNEFFRVNDFEVRDRMNTASIKIQHETVWGICDEDLFTMCIEEADKSCEKNKPFLQVILTTSNHRPFTYPENKIDLPPYKSGRQGAVKYADYAIGDFVKRSSSKPWFDNTIFVFMADHGPSSAGKLKLNPESHVVPLIIYAPSIVKPAEINTPISQIDAVPTVLGIMKFNYVSRFYGKDVMKSDYESTCFVANYQHVGLLKPLTASFVTMSPGRKIECYKNSEKKSDVAAFQSQIDEAIAYYQEASEWRTNMKIK